jgi:hypothetical protein
MFASSKSLSRIAVLFTALALAALPSVASAAERYASPTGGGVGCTSAVPCSLADAVKVAVEGDEVIASPGDYPLTKTLEDQAKITIRGVPGQPRPRLLFSGPYQTGLRLMNGSLLRDVEIEQAEAVAAVDTSGARLDRVVVRGGRGVYDCSVSLLNGIIRDSIVISDRLPICSFADGVPNTSVYRNVTAVTTQLGQAAILISAPSASATVDLTNVIAQGPSGPGFRIVTDLPGSQATVTATHSNFGDPDILGGNIQFIDGGGNQHAAPSFVNAAAGDYREAPGSVTIDKGINEPLNGAFDVDGDPRRIFTTDIGADEFVPAPTVVTGPASGIGPQSATLIGNVTAIGVPTSYHFEYGPTTAYGSFTPATDLAVGVGQLPVAATLDGLAPGTTYHFRLVATNKGGVREGLDQSFATPAATPSGSNSSSTPTFAGVTLVSTRLALSGKFITVKLSCPAGTVGGCSGETKLSARRRSGTRRVALGKARFSIAAGGRAKLRMRVSRAGLQRLRGLRRLRARDANAAHDGAGVSKTTVTTVTVRRVH